MLKFMQLLQRSKYMNMSIKCTSHLERTASLPRNKVNAAGTVTQLKNISGTVKLLSLKIQDPQFTFKAGQWVDFTIPGIKTVGGFSMSSSPNKLEKERVIELAVKKSDHPPANWIHTKCKVGDEVHLKVGGDFFLEPSTFKFEYLLLVAGGVGINPLYSMIQQVCESKDCGQMINTCLLYSAADEEELIFKNELRKLATVHSNFRCHFFVTKGDGSLTSEMNKGRIDAGKIREATKTFVAGNTAAYICGPPPMIRSLAETLQTFGINDINKEEWW